MVPVPGPAAPAPDARPGEWMDDEVGGWPGAAGVAGVGPSGILAATGEDETHPWASVTKIPSALTVLLACADGVLDLDEAAGPPGATLRHLLGHTSGLAFDSDRTLAEPGKRRIYSNRGIEVAAEALEARTGRPFADLMTDHVLHPLGMKRSGLDGSPARDGSGPVSDLALLAHELLVPRVLDPALVALATTTSYAGTAGVLPGFGRQDPNDWGLGLEVRGHKSPHWTSPDNSPSTFGHFGQSGSFLWVDPVAQLACVSAGDTPYDTWAAEAWPRLSTRVLAEFVGRGANDVSLETPGPRSST